MSSNDLFNALNDAQKYLMQQNTLFGDTLYIDPQKEPNDSATDSVFMYPDEPWVHAQTLDELTKGICTCLKCPLGQTRKNFVFGVGNPREIGRAHV